MSDWYLLSANFNDFVTILVHVNCNIINWDNVVIKDSGFNCRFTHLEYTLSYVQSTVSVMHLIVHNTCSVLHDIKNNWSILSSNHITNHWDFVDVHHLAILRCEDNLTYNLLNFVNSVHRSTIHWRVLNSNNSYSNVVVNSFDLNYNTNHSHIVLFLYKNWTVDWHHNNNSHQVPYVYYYSSNQSLHSYGSSWNTS